MRRSLRIPYAFADSFAPPAVSPSTAGSLDGAVSALHHFLRGQGQGQGQGQGHRRPTHAVVLSGAGLSVSSGLSDYRGPKGAYRLNPGHRPIYFHEFLASHEARKRYWARSFLGWRTLHTAGPNAGHFAVRDLGALGLVKTVVTQNVDSFHPKAHPDIPTIELHGYLRSTVCTTCHNEFPRDTFQGELARLNPAWAAFLAEAIASGALETEDPHERRARGIRTTPDGDVDLPDAPYTTFRYPPCPHCLSMPPPLADGTPARVETDRDGAWSPTSGAGVLKPAVVMFGESISTTAKQASEEAIDNAGRLLVLGTSLATYSAWRLVKRAKDQGIPMAIVNIGGVRGEESFFTDLDPQQDGSQGVRVELPTESLLPALVESLRKAML